MKFARGVAAFLSFLLCVAAATAADEPPFDFGLSGKVTIIKATSWFDGGSVTVLLKDEQGHQADAGYRGTERDHAGQCMFMVPPAATPTIFPKGGVNEQVLYKLLDEACLATYGTDDPQQLNASKDWNQFAMAEILRRLKVRAGSHPAKP